MRLERTREDYECSLGETHSWAASCQKEEERKGKENEESKKQKFGIKRKKIEQASMQRKELE